MFAVRALLMGSLIILLIPLVERLLMPQPPVVNHHSANDPAKYNGTKIEVRNASLANGTRTAPNGTLMNATGHDAPNSTPEVTTALAAPNGPPEDTTGLAESTTARSDDGLQGDGHEQDAFSDNCPADQDHCSNELVPHH